MKYTGFLIFAIIMFLCGTGLSAQDLDTLTIAPLDTVKTHKVVYPEHLIGFRYSYNLTNVKSNVSVNQVGYNSPINLEILYTYYHPLWNYIGYFGIQTGLRYTKYGFSSDANIRNFDQVVTAIQLPVFSAFHFDIGKHFRILLNLGPYLGYRLSTTKEEGWDCFDKRFEWGIEGQGGFGFRFGPIDLHFTAGYMFGFGFLYHPEKFSSSTWLYTYPNAWSFGCGIYYKLK